MKKIDTYEKAYKILNAVVKNNVMANTIDSFDLYESRMMGTFYWIDDESELIIYATPYWESSVERKAVPISVENTDNGEILLDAEFELDFREENEFFDAYTNLMKNVIQLIKIKM